MGSNIDGMVKLLLNGDRVLGAKFGLGAEDMYLLQNYEKPELAEVSGVNSSRHVELRPDAAAALKDMNAAYKKETKRTMYVNSAFRSPEEQLSMYLEWVEGGRKGSVVGRPSQSNHRSGVAVDISFLDKKYLPANEAERKSGDYSKSELRSGPAIEDWLHEHGAEYGFVQRYGDSTKKGSNASIPGEKHHWEYVGVEEAQAWKLLAKQIEGKSEYNRYIPTGKYRKEWKPEVPTLKTDIRTEKQVFPEIELSQIWAKEEEEGFETPGFFAGLAAKVSNRLKYGKQQ